MSPPPPFPSPPPPPPPLPPPLPPSPHPHPHPLLKIQPTITEGSQTTRHQSPGLIGEENRTTNEVNFSGRKQTAVNRRLPPRKLRQFAPVYGESSGNYRGRCRQTAAASLVQAVFFRRDVFTSATCSRWRANTAGLLN